MNGHSKRIPDGQAPAGIPVEFIRDNLRRGRYDQLRATLEAHGAPVELLNSVAQTRDHAGRFPNFPYSRQLERSLATDVEAWLASVLPADDPSRYMHLKEGGVIV